MMARLVSLHNPTQKLGGLSSNNRPQGKEGRHKPLGMQEMQMDMEAGSVIHKP